MLLITAYNGLNSRTVTITTWKLKC